MKNANIFFMIVILIYSCQCSPKKPKTWMPQNSQLDRKTTVKNPELYYNLALEASQRNENNTALNYIDKAISLSPDERYFYVKGLINMKDGKFQESLNIFQEIIKKNPSSPLKSDVLNGIGSCFLNMDKLDDAAKIFREVLADPTYMGKFHPYYNLGLIYMKQGRDDDAEQVFKKAIEENPSHHPSYKYLGIIMQKKHNLDDAERYFSRAVEIIADDFKAVKMFGSEYYFNLGEIHFEKKDYQKASEFLKKAWDISPESPTGQSAKDLLKKIQGESK